MAHNYLTINTYYPALLASHRSHPERAGVDYEGALGAPMVTCLGTSDLYSTSLQLLGREVLSLPVLRQLTEDEIEYVCASRSTQTNESSCGVRSRASTGKKRGREHAIET